MDHLACFVPGMLALGAYAKPDAPTFARDMQTAKAMAYTCWQMYERTATGIAPEYVNFEPGRDNVVARELLVLYCTDFTSLLDKQRSIRHAILNPVRTR